MRTIKHILVFLIFGALVITARDSVTPASASGTISPEGLPDYGQFGNSWDVVPSSFVLRMTNSGLSKLGQQVASLLVQPAMKRMVNDAILLAGTNQSNPLGCSYGDPGNPSNISNSMLTAGGMGIRSCGGLSCLSFPTGSCTGYGCGCSGVPSCPCNQVCIWQIGCACTCWQLASACEDYAVYIRDNAGANLVCPGLNPTCDETVLYYNNAQVTLTPTAPNALTAGITFLNNPSISPTCYANNAPCAPNNVPISNVHVDIWDTLGASWDATASACNINATATITPVFAQVASVWGPDLVLQDVTVTNVNVAVPGLYINLGTGCIVNLLGLWCVIGYDTGTIQLNSLVTSLAGPMIVNALQSQLGSQLQSALRSALCQNSPCPPNPLMNITQALGEPFKLAKACYLTGVWPYNPSIGTWGLISDAYGFKLNTNTGMVPITTTTGLPNIPQPPAMTWAQMAQQCPYKGCADLSSTPMPPLDLTPYGNSVFNRTTVPNWPGAANVGAPYDLGYGISESLLNEILYNLYISGLFCQEIDAGSIDTFAHFIPMLKSIADPGSKVTIRLVLSPPVTPLDPIQRTGYPVQAWIGQGSCGSSVCDAWAELSNYRLDFYVTVGGVPARAFSILWDLQFGGDMSYVFVPGGVQPTSTTIGTTLPGYYHLVLVLNPTVIKVDNLHPAIPASALRGGIGQALPVLLSSKAYAEINTALNLAGFTVGFDYIGPDYDAIGADGRPHFLSFYGVMLGNIDWKWLLLAPPQGGPSAPQVFINMPPLVAQTRGLAPAGMNSLNLSALETREAGFTPEKAMVGFTGRASDGSSNVEYSWRLDNGFWQPFTTTSRAGLSGLLEGRHVFDVTVRAPGNQGPVSPARMEFIMDSVPPEISLDHPSKRVRGDTARFTVIAGDYQTSEEDIQVSYRTDNKDWISIGFSRQIVLSGLSEGSHTLNIRAWDSAYNESIMTHTFRAGAGWGCDGCSQGPGGSPSSSDLLNFAVWLLPLVLLWVLRRKRPGSGDGQSWALHPCASGAGHHRRESDGRPRPYL